jgi:hypothetical protein
MADGWERLPQAARFCSDLRAFHGCGLRFSRPCAHLIADATLRLGAWLVGHITFGDPDKRPDPRDLIVLQQPMFTDGCGRYWLDGYRRWVEFVGEDSEKFRVGTQGVRRERGRGASLIMIISVGLDG